MPKYDDFGRPIYETAEEYNQAHRNGVCPRTYDTSENSTSYSKKKIRFNTQKETMKKSKILIIGVAIYFVIILAVLVFSMVSNIIDGYYESKSEYEYEEEEWDDMDEDSFSEYLGDATIPLPEGFEKFSYNGQSYTLPTTYQEISQMGFVLDGAEYDENDRIPTDFEETICLNDEYGYITVMLGISNYDDEEILLEDAAVHYIYIDNPASYDETLEVPDFVFGDGFTFESSYEELEAYFGVPYYHYQDHSEEGYYYDNYEWSYYGEDEIHYVSVTFWNGAISDVGIEKRTVE